MAGGMRWRGISCPSCGCNGQEGTPVYCECNPSGQDMTWPEYIPFSIDIFAGFNWDNYAWTGRSTTAVELGDAAYPNCGTITAPANLPLPVGTVTQDNNLQVSGQLVRWTGSSTADPIGITGPPAGTGCWWKASVDSPAGLEGKLYANYFNASGDDAKCWGFTGADTGRQNNFTETYYSGVQALWFNSVTGYVHFIPKEIWYPVYCVMDVGDMTPVVGSGQQLMLVGWEKVPVVTGGSTISVSASIQVFKEACVDPEFPCSFIMKDHVLDCDARVVDDPLTEIPENGDYILNLNPPSLHTCDCYFNQYGDGCNPFNNAENPNPITDFVWTRDGQSTVTQNGPSYWDSDSSPFVTEKVIRVPVDTTVGFQTYVTFYNDNFNQAGRYVSMAGGNPSSFAQRFLLDSCTGSIVGTDTANPVESIAFTAVDWTDCGEPEGPPEQPSGCCELPNGTVQNGTLQDQCDAVGGTWSEDSVCPPTGCCQIGGSSDLSGVTEAHCTTQGGTWTEGVECGTGFCTDDSTGQVTAGIEEDECSGTWTATEPTMGCCDISGTEHPDVAEAWCTSQSGTFTAGDCPTPPLGWCINDSTGAITPNVLEADCSGTWSATEPVSGCCTISGTPNPDVAESWCTGQSGTFVAGDCPTPSFDPCGESWAATMNSFALEMNDPNFNLSNPFYMYDGSYSQSPNALRRDVCSVLGAQLDAVTVEVYGDHTSDPTNISVASNTDVKYDSTSGTWAVEAYITWSNSGTTYNITASKSGISIPSAGCPSVSVTGSFDTFSGNYTQSGGGGTSFSVADLVGSFNITLTCE